ncbi:hypothetical protein [Mycolicibacterium sp. XJ879]
MDQYALHLLGGFAVQTADRTVDLPPACQRLVALLALKRRPMHRLWVRATLWPHTQTRKAVASLRSAVWRMSVVETLGHGAEKPTSHHLRNTIRSVHTGRPVIRRQIHSGDPRER